jgi:hypothetical protein
MTHRFLTSATALATLAAAPFCAFAHAGTDDGGHHGFLAEWLFSFSDAQYLSTFAAAGLSCALAMALVRQQRAHRVAQAKGARR